MSSAPVSHRALAGTGRQSGNRQEPVTDELPDHDVKMTIVDRSLTRELRRLDDKIDNKLHATLFTNIKFVIASCSEYNTAMK